MHPQTSKIIGTILNYKKSLKDLNIRAEKIILYGSYATGKQRKDSDIDLIVISNDFRKMNIRERLEILGIAAGRLMKPIEALGYTSQEINNSLQGSFIKEILRTGVII